MITQEHLYVYRVHVTRIIDFNTFVGNLDMGLGIIKHKARIQLTEGEELSEHEQSTLPGKSILVKSHYIDGFGRVVATLYPDEAPKKSCSV